MANKNMMQDALHRYTDETDVDSLFDDDIDTFDEVQDEIEFETDENGNYVRILPHLTEFLGLDETCCRKRDELFHESVVETVLETWQHCKAMCSTLLPKYPYVGIVLDTKIPEIGGFTKKHRRDEQKGTIIECVNSGSIVVLMTPILLDRQYFVILPNVQTLESMSEFPLLTEHVYHVCFISRIGEVQLTDIEISYKAIANMILKDLCIQDILISAMEGYDPGKSEVDEHDFSYEDALDEDREFSGEDEDDEFLFNGGVSDEET